MSKLDTAPYKGVQDFYPEDMRVENYIFRTWRKVVEDAGYEEYSASPLEPAELYKEKSGEEIVNEQMFTFTDRGGREVALRPEMTPSLARMVAAKRKSLRFPLRWFSIPNVFRYERPQRGRRREHYQLNVDLIGEKNQSADADVIEVAVKIMNAFGASQDIYEIRINTLSKDRSDLEDVIKRLEKMGINNVRVDETLQRGQTYYTGVVFEFFDTNTENNRSILGGGRYDDLLQLFDAEPVPTVGFAVGDITMRDFLETHNLPLGK